MELGDEVYTNGEVLHALFWRTFSTKDEAIQYATKVCSTEAVEYGIRIDTNDD